MCDEFRVNFCLIIYVEGYLISCFILFCLDVEKMVSLKGMIIRCSSVIPEIRESVFRCLVCGYYSDPILVDRGNCLA